MKNKNYPIFTFKDKIVFNYGTVHDLTYDVDYHQAKNNSYFRWECPYCKIECESDSIYGSPDRYQRIYVTYCKRCGWWSYESDTDDLSEIPSFHSAQAIMESFSISDKAVPIKPLKEYVANNKDRLRDIHPAKFEEMVASIYSEVFGYKVEFCSYCRPDKGIDVIVLDTNAEKKIAIQVKRYNRPIELGFIHQFFGAMVDSSFKHGVFVTSGNYRSGAIKTVASLKNKTNIVIDLVDGKKFLEYIDVWNKEKRAIDATICPMWEK